VGRGEEQIGPLGRGFTRRAVPRHQLSKRVCRRFDRSAWASQWGASCQVAARGRPKEWWRAHSEVRQRDRASLQAVGASVVIRCQRAAPRRLQAAVGGAAVVAAVRSQAAAQAQASAHRLQAAVGGAAVIIAAQASGLRQGQVGGRDQTSPPRATRHAGLKGMRGGTGAQV
jgi:hypothetical protein